MADVLIRANQLARGDVVRLFPFGEATVTGTEQVTRWLETVVRTTAGTFTLTARREVCARSLAPLPGRVMPGEAPVCGDPGTHLHNIEWHGGSCWECDLLTPPA